MRRFDRDSAIITILVVLATIATVGIVAFAIWHHENFVRICHEHGGQVLKTNCETYTTCTNQDMGDGYSTFSCTDSESCDYYCTATGERE